MENENPEKVYWDFLNYFVERNQLIIHEDETDEGFKIRVKEFYNIKD